MLARAALGAIIKAAAKSAAKKVATKEVGKVAEKAVAKGASRTLGKSEKDIGKMSINAESRGKLGSRITDVKPKAKAKTTSTPKKSLSSSASKESKARGDGPSKGETKGWAREAKANRDAKTADHYEGPKEPATSAGRKLGDKPKAKARKNINA